ncbi:dual specificity protein kinase Ttk [Latimeria chalumnae]|uniref:dual specificity protein kinase Ttk n=1 Tax=Latimeria chalumnae TaxID=7897 RepID=UPI00313AFDD5
MDDEDSEVKQRMASILSKVKSLTTKYHLEDNTTDELNFTKSFADNTDHSNTVKRITQSTNTPEDWLPFLQNVEMKSDPEVDADHLKKLIDLYSQAVAALPVEAHCKNESYARIVVRFAELKAIGDVDEAHDQFQLARVNCKTFSFVHVAAAQLELSQGNLKKCNAILQKAVEICASPIEIVETAMQNVRLGKMQLLSEEKENVQVPAIHGIKDILQSNLFSTLQSRISDGSSGEVYFNRSAASQGVDQSDLTDENVGLRGGRKPLMQLNKPSHKTWQFGRVLMQPLKTPDIKDDYTKADAPCSTRYMKSQFLEQQLLLLRLCSQNRGRGVLTRAKECFQGNFDAGFIPPTFDVDYCSAGEDFPETIFAWSEDEEREILSPDEDGPSPGEQRLFHLEDVDYLIKLVSSTLNLSTPPEDSGPSEYPLLFAEDNPQQTSGYKPVNILMPTLSKPNYSSENEDSSSPSSIKAELLCDPLESQASVEEDYRTASTATLINKTKTSAIKTKAGTQSQLTEQKETKVLLRNKNVMVEARPAQPKAFTSDQAQCKRACVDGTDWKFPERVSDWISPEAKNTTSEQPSLVPVSKQVALAEAVAKEPVPVFVCETPRSKLSNDYMSCFSTPVVKNSFPGTSQISTPYNYPIVCPQLISQTPAASQFPGPSQVPFGSNCFVIKGRIYSVLKQIGSGGSSKVFQVVDQKSRICAVKMVNLIESDQQTIESYQNEITHLSKLQKHSDKIIRLYDYEITNSVICMVMECGSIDLAAWLRKKKTIDPLERKSYWKNMLQAVHTIHEHGIIHSDLKPANFLIVDGMLKLIDFGIANQIQPDVTSIVKDSQVGTVNFMSPETIRDMSYAENGKPRSKISPKSDVWSLGCILYCMTYGRTPFQHITSQISKLHAIIDPSHEIEFPDIPEKDLQDVLKGCLVRNPKERLSISQLLAHQYVQIQSSQMREAQQSKETKMEMKRILAQLIDLNSPNSISRAAKKLYEQCNSDTNLDVSAFAKSSKQKDQHTKGF